MQGISSTAASHLQAPLQLRADERGHDGLKTGFRYVLQRPEDERGVQHPPPEAQAGHHDREDLRDEETSHAWRAEEERREDGAQSRGDRA